MSGGPDLPTAPPVESCHKWAYVTAGSPDSDYQVMAIDQMGRLWLGQFRGEAGSVYWWEANKPEVTR